MITLYTFGPAFGLPDPSPFVTKAEVLVKMAGLAYEVNPKGFGRAPKGKLPYINDDGTVVADSTFIRLHLESRHGIDFDQGLSAAERGLAWAVEKLLEDNFYWVLVHGRWMDDANFARGPAQFFKAVPAPIRPLVSRMVRRKVRGYLHGQGIGRHRPAEIAVLAKRTIRSLADILGDKPYLMGDKPCGADATLFAFVAGALCPLFDTPILGLTSAEANLVAYRDRLMAQYYSGFIAG